MSAPAVAVFRDSADTVGEGPALGRGAELPLVGRRDRQAHPARPTSPRRNGRDLASGRASRRRWRWRRTARWSWRPGPPGTVSTRRRGADLIAEIAVTSPAMRLNDGVVDAARPLLGRARCAAAARAGRHSSTGSRGGQGPRRSRGCARRTAARSRPTAGPSISPTATRRCCTIWAFDFDAETGALANRRVFHRPARGRPDGAAIDAEGCYWFAAVDAGRIVQLDPRRPRDARQSSCRSSRPTKPAFGGAGPRDDLRDLDERRHSTRPREPLAGAVFAVEAGARGHPPAARRLRAFPRTAETEHQGGEP